MVDLPCIVEAQKTLDYKTFFKSCDAAQMLYVHNYFIDLENMEKDEKQQVAEFNPLEDISFF